MEEAGGLGVKEDETLGSYLEQWLAHVKGRVRATTYEGYRTLVRRHALPRLGAVPLGDLSPLDIQRTYAAMLEGGRREAPRSPDRGEPAPGPAPGPPPGRAVAPGGVQPRRGG